MIIENNSDALGDVPKFVNQKIITGDLHPNGSVMECNQLIPSAANTLKKIHLDSDFYNEFISMF